MNTEFSILRVKIQRKTTGANVHKAENLLGALRMIIEEYSQTKNKKWLDVYKKLKKKLLNS